MLARFWIFLQHSHLCRGARSAPRPVERPRLSERLDLASSAMPKGETDLYERPRAVAQEMLRPERHLDRPLDSTERNLVSTNAFNRCTDRSRRTTPVHPSPLPGAPRLPRPDDADCPHPTLPPMFACFAPAQWAGVVARRRRGQWRSGGGGQRVQPTVPWCARCQRQGSAGSDPHRGRLLPRLAPLNRQRRQGWRHLHRRRCVGGTRGQGLEPSALVPGGEHGVH